MTHLRDEMENAAPKVDEGLSAERVIAHRRHRRRMHWLLRPRNGAVAGG